jgi:hypothetical protein
MADVRVLFLATSSAGASLTAALNHFSGGGAPKGGRGVNRPDGCCAGGGAWYVPPPHGEGEQPGLQLWLIARGMQPVVASVAHALRPFDEPSGRVLLCPVLDVSSPDTLSWQVAEVTQLLAETEALVPGAQRGALLLAGADRLLPGCSLPGKPPSSSPLLAQSPQHVAALIAYARLVALFLGGLGVHGLAASSAAAPDRPCGQSLGKLLREGKDSVRPLVVTSEARELLHVPAGADSVAAVRAFYVSEAALPGRPCSALCPIVGRSLVALQADGATLEALGVLATQPWLPSGYAPRGDPDAAAWAAKTAALRALGGSPPDGNGAPSMGAWAEAVAGRQGAHTGRRAAAAVPPAEAATVPASPALPAAAARLPASSSRQSLGSAGVGPGSRLSLGVRSRTSSVGSEGSVASAGTAGSGAQRQAPTEGAPAGGKPPAGGKDPALFFQGLLRKPPPGKAKG